MVRAPLADSIMYPITVITDLTALPLLAATRIWALRYAVLVVMVAAVFVATISLIPGAGGHGASSELREPGFSVKFLIANGVCYSRR